ncbi:MAG TPA: hypothetical protein VE133_18730 [Candidatus Sulfotelmatobacter sp.]|nr:hypothetical protein [Candidatus Sulfotelmatobacter sp.]
MKRFFVLMAILCVARAAAFAQKADVAFVAGGSFVSDSQSTFSTGPGAITSLKTDNHIFLEGTLGVRMLDAKLASLHFEVPVAGIPSQKLTLGSTPSTVIDHISTVFVTPSLRLKLLPVAPISPWVSFGGGWARYGLDSGTKTNKGAVQYGGGLDFKTGLPVLGFRAEVRDFVTGDPDFGLGTVLAGNTKGGLHHHNVLLGGGIVLRF